MASLDSLRLGVPSSSSSSFGGVVDDDDEDVDIESGSNSSSGGDTRPLVSSHTRNTRSDRATLLGAHTSNKSKGISGVGGGISNSNVSNDLSSVDSALDRTSRALADTELLGQLTSAQLMIQRESFLRQRAQLSQTDEYLKRTKNLLQRMQFRLVTDKIVQGIIIMVELAAIGAIVYLKYYK